MPINILNSKYALCNIQEALKPWEYAKDVKPEIKSVISRFARANVAMFMDSQENIGTSFVIHKVHSLVGMFNLLQHYYLVVDGKAWHPGYIDELTIFYDSDKEKNSKIIKIEEKCHYCLYRDMQEKFIRDKQFHIITNNCQRITGHITETIFVISYHIFISLALFFGNLLMLILAILSVVCIIIYNRLNVSSSELQMQYCPHIKI